MTHFIAIKIHYDHRKSLPAHLKYSLLPTVVQYREYLRLFREEGKGGNGFHECMNFAIDENGKSTIYLPPTCKPADKYLDEEMVIFSFTYKQDEELPAHIVGVHAGASILDKEGISRPDIYQLEGIDEEFHYHAEAPGFLTTLFTPPIEYDFRKGIHTPAYPSWGFGLRNIEKQHALNIVKSAFILAQEKLKNVETLSEREIIRREIDVLTAIDNRYFNSQATKEFAIKLPRKFGDNQPPDQEIGYLGERIVYETELTKVKEIGGKESDVEWISQISPQSPFDIKTVRLVDGELKDFYIEVKSSRSFDNDNIYVSSGQVEFFSNIGLFGEFALVNFYQDKSVKSIEYLSFSQLETRYDFTPIKYKLIAKAVCPG